MTILYDLYAVAIWCLVAWLVWTIVRVHGHRPTPPIEPRASKDDLAAAAREASARWRISHSPLDRDELAELRRLGRRAVRLGGAP
jgi:hypothetical protein